MPCGWPSHEPVGHADYSLLGDDLEPEPRVEPNIVLRLGLQVARQVRLVKVSAVGVKYLRTDASALEMGVNPQRTKVRVRLFRVKFAPRRRQADRAQEGTWTSREHRRNEPEALSIRGLASARGRDAGHRDDGLAIETDEWRLVYQGDAKHRPEHHFEAPAPAFGIPSEQGRGYGVVTKATSEQGYRCKELIWLKVAYLHDRPVSAAHRLTIPERCRAVLGTLTGGAVAGPPASGVMDH